MCTRPAARDTRLQVLALPQRRAFKPKQPCQLHSEPLPVVPIATLALWAFPSVPALLRAALRGISPPAARCAVQFQKKPWLPKRLALFLHGAPVWPEDLGLVAGERDHGQGEWCWQCVSSRRCRQWFAMATPRLSSEACLLGQLSPHSELPLHLPRAPSTGPPSRDAPRRQPAVAPLGAVESRPTGERQAHGAPPQLALILILFNL